jgi:hypothetical protein
LVLPRPASGRKPDFGCNGESKTQTPGFVKCRVNTAFFDEEALSKCCERLERGRLVRVTFGGETRGRAARAPVAKVPKKLCQSPFVIKLQARLDEAPN